MSRRSELQRGARRACPGAAPRLVALGCLAMLSARARASQLAVSPTLNVVPAGKVAAAFVLRNLGDEPVTIQVQAVSWSQAQGEDRYAPAARLLIVPPLFTIPAASRQIVRLALEKRNPGHESAFRVSFREVPPAPPPGFFGVRTALDLNVPLFFAPPNAQQSLALTAHLTTGGNLQLSISNRGSGFARLTGITLQDPGGRSVAALKGPQYILAGSSRSWALPAAPGLQRGEKLTADIGSGLSHREIPLTLE